MATPARPIVISTRRFWAPAQLPGVMAPAPLSDLRDRGGFDIASRDHRTTMQASTCGQGIVSLSVKRDDVGVGMATRELLLVDIASGAVAPSGLGRLRRAHRSTPNSQPAV